MTSVTTFDAARHIPLDTGTVSPITGWTRHSWASLADHMLCAVRPYASPGHARITLPGPPGGYGSDVDGLEGFARTFLLAGFRLAGENGREPDAVAGLAEWYADGIATGVDPAAPDRWVRPDEHPQAKVEAASIALILDLTRPWIWDQLASGVRERVVEYLSPVVGDHSYPHNNWLWFRVVVETFLWSVGGPWSPSDVEADLALHDSFYRADGWYSDGDGRAFDHYVGWAMHLYPILWARMRGMSQRGGELGMGRDGGDGAGGDRGDGAGGDHGLGIGGAAGAGGRAGTDSAAETDRSVGAGEVRPSPQTVTPATLAAERGDLDTRRLRSFLPTYLALVGGDGSPLVQGRSLTYRFAAAAPLWAGVLAGVDEPAPGMLRRAASGIVDHFVGHGVPDGRGLLTLGWHHAWRRLAQSYSGPSSPYWAAKGMLGLALPADHPAWTATEQPLPAERDAYVRAEPVPGWLVSTTRDDGIVRVVNHGTDHATPGSTAGDSPLYARVAYSTATAPLMSPDAWESPVDQSVTLLDTQDRATHRAGMRMLSAQLADGGAAVGASVSRVRWIEVASGQRDHGSGRSGAVREAGVVTVLSAVRGAWEVRCVRVDPLPDAPQALSDARVLRIGGWPVAGPDMPRWIIDEPHSGSTAWQGEQLRTVEATVSQVTSALVAGAGFDTAGVHPVEDASPLGRYSATPWVAGPVAAGQWRVAAVGLSGTTLGWPPEVAFEGEPGPLQITWADGERTHVDLPHVPPAHLSGRG